MTATSKKIFMTGASGFVGSYLKSFLQQSGHDVDSSEALNFEKPKTIAEILGQQKWDTLVHLGGISSYAEAEKNSERAFLINTASTEQIAKHLIQYSPQTHFIFASSAQVYAPTESHDQPTVLTEEAKLGPINTYGKTKLEAENILLKLNSQHGLPMSLLRFFNHTHKTQSTAAFLPHIYHELIENSPPVAIKVGNVDLNRDLSVITDLLHALKKVIEAPPAEEADVFNICSGQARNLRQLIHLLAQNLNVQYSLEVESSRLRPNEPISICGSNKKFRKHYDWQPIYQSDSEFIQGFLTDVQ